MDRRVYAGIAVLLQLVAMVLVLYQKYMRPITLSGDSQNQVLTVDEATAIYEWFKKQEEFIQKCLKNEEFTKQQYDGYYNELLDEITEWTDLMNKEEARLWASYNAHRIIMRKHLWCIRRYLKICQSLFHEVPMICTS